MKTILRFARHYDVDLLLRDLKTAEQEAKFHVHWSDYHDGGWKAIPLVSPDGDMGPEKPYQHTAVVRYAKTPLLSKCPYFEEIIDGFLCSKNRVRLLRLEPGANIHTHTDPEDAWAWGRLVRLHIPIVTHDQVHFYVSGQRVFMRPGELWYCDFSRPHRVANLGTVGRVHLVLDLELNDWLRSTFPGESLAERFSNWIYRRRYPAEQALYRWGRAAGLGGLRRKLRSLAQSGRASRSRV